MTVTVNVPEQNVYIAGAAHFLSRAGDALADNSAERVRSMILELIWILYPGLTLAAILQLSNAMIAKRKQDLTP